MVHWINGEYKGLGVYLCIQSHVLLFIWQKEFSLDHFQDNDAEISLIGSFFGWAGLDCNILIKIFSFCPSSSLVKYGLHGLPPSRVALQALPGGNFIWLCSVTCISCSFFSLCQLLFSYSYAILWSSNLEVKLCFSLCRKYRFLQTVSLWAMPLRAYRFQWLPNIPLKAEEPAGHQRTLLSWCCTLVTNFCGALLCFPLDALGNVLVR